MDLLCHIEAMETFIHTVGCCEDVPLRDDSATAFGSIISFYPGKHPHSLHISYERVLIRWLDFQTPKYSVGHLSVVCAIIILWTEVRLVIILHRMSLQCRDIVSPELGLLCEGRVLSVEVQ